MTDRIAEIREGIRKHRFGIGESGYVPHFSPEEVCEHMAWVCDELEWLQTEHDEAVALLYRISGSDKLTPTIERALGDLLTRLGAS